MWRKTQGKQVRSRDKQEIPEERGEGQDGELAKNKNCRRNGWRKQNNRNVECAEDQYTHIHGGRFGEIVKLCKRSGMDIAFLTELNTFSHGIKKFEIDGESMYLLHSTKTGVLMRGWQSNNSGIYRFINKLGGSGKYEQEIEEVRRKLERVIHGIHESKLSWLGGY